MADLVEKEVEAAVLAEKEVEVAVLVEKEVDTAVLEEKEVEAAVLVEKEVVEQDIEIDTPIVTHTYKLLKSSTNNISQYIRTKDPQPTVIKSHATPQRLSSCLQSLVEPSVISKTNCRLPP